MASNLTITQKWSVSLNDAKVGDVIQRSISRFAGGTLSEFLPETKFDSIYGISIYPKRAQVKTNKSRTGVSSQRIETVNYLFEKEGEITLPAITYVYWNSSNKKFYQKQIDSIQILVKPNADLKMLASIKKSLQNEKIEDTSEKRQAFLIFGLSPLEFLKYVLITLVGLIIVIKLVKYLVEYIRIKRVNCLNSEQYAYKQLKKALLKGDHNSYFRTTNLWLKKLNTSNSLDEFINIYGTKNMKRFKDQNNEALFKNDDIHNKPSFYNLVNEFKNARIKFFLQQKNRNNSKTKGWLNPVSFD